MKKRNGYLSRLASHGFLADENPIRQPLVELYADRRVLIENHDGVAAYSTEEILIHTKLGIIFVYGDCLKICMMSNQQLVISGKIRQISLERREQACVSGRPSRGNYA